VSRATALLALSLAGTPAAGQSLPAADDVADFVTAVRAATERYRDQANAIADGYRRIGPDFPSMGEHWLSIPLVVRGEVDPLHPPILEYITVGGRPILAGVAYTQLVRDGVPRARLPAPASAWHYHAGSVDEESFILSHAQNGGAMDSSGEPRIAVLHAWIWLENPAGLFATDNWALPWHRLGIPAPPESNGPSPAGMAAALASGGEPYFLTLLRLRNGLTSEMADQVAQVMERHVRSWRERLGIVADQGLPPPLGELTTAWSAFEAELQPLFHACSPLPHPSHH
jgi:hypothetical protein